jgi:hypothetical protein
MEESSLASSSNARKRPRSSSPAPSSSGGGGSGKATGGVIPEETDLASQLGSKDPVRRNAALNELLKFSASHEINYSLEGDEVLQALVQIAHDTLDWQPAGLPSTENSSSSPSPSPHKKKKQKPPSFDARVAWTEPITPLAKEWAAHCEEKLSRKSLDPEKMKPLEVVLGILRNLSFVAANLRLLAYSPDVIAILVGCLYENMSTENLCFGDDFSSAVNSNGSSSGTTGSSGNMRTLALPALNVLLNLAPYLDVTGQKLLCDKLFLSVSKTSTDETTVTFPTPSLFGLAADGSWGFGGLWLAKRLDTKEDVVNDVSKELLLQLTHEHLASVWSIFPGLARILSDSSTPRPLIMMALDVLQEFINHARVGVVGAVVDSTDDSQTMPNARSIVVHIPTKVLDRLGDLLYVPRLGPDALDYVDPVRNIVTRVTTLKLLMGYDANVDTDVRDRALDVLVPLLELDSPAMAKRLGAQEDKKGRMRNRLFDALCPILTTQAGRNEAPLLATQLLRELAKAPENRIGLMYLQHRIATLASKDQRVAHLALNHLYAKREQVVVETTAVEVAGGSSNQSE